MRTSRCLLVSAVVVLTLVLPGCDLLTGGGVTGVSLNKTSLELSVGGTEQLQATVSPATAANQAVTWTSSDAAVATVTSGGLVEALALGSAAVTVTTAQGSFTATCQVTVGVGSVVGDRRDYAVGYGYDIYGEWADPTCIESEILDTARLVSEGILTTQTLAGNLEERICEGTTEESYLKTLDVNASVSGHYLMYYAEVSTNFHKESYSTNRHSFATYYGELTQQVVRVEPTYCYADMLKPYLTEEFRAAIDGSNTTYGTTDEGIANLFRDFGTHVVLKAYRGARINYRASCDMTTIGGSKSIGAYVKAGFEMGIAGAELNTSIVSQTEWESFESASDISVSQQGGNTDLTTLSNYSSWKTGMQTHPEQWTLVAFETNAAEQGFLPIWDFAPDLHMFDMFGNVLPSRRDKILEYFEDQWSTTRSKPVTLPLTYGTLKVRLYWLNNDSVQDYYMLTLPTGEAQFRWRIRAVIGGQVNLQEDLSDTRSENTFSDPVTIKPGYCIMFADQEEEGGFTEYAVPASTYAQYEYEIFNTSLLATTGSLVIYLELAEQDAYPWDHSSNAVFATFGNPAFYFRYDKATDRWSFESIVNPPTVSGDSFQVINPQVRARGAGEAKHRLHLPAIVDGHLGSMEIVMGLVWD